MRRLLALLLVVAAAVLAAGCGETRSGAAVGDRKVRVTTTTNFITDTVRRVGGPRVEVTGLMGAGVDPHLYKASAGDIEDLREADVIFYGGLQLEGKMDDLLEKLSERQTTVAVTRGMPRERLLEPPAGAKEERDPHVWFDVALWRHAVTGIRDALAKKDPRHAAGYRSRAAAYLRRLDELDRYARRRLATIPRERRVLVTSHDAFAYLGRAYDVDVEAIQGISTASEATTADVQRVAATIADRGVRAVFVESSVPRQTIDAVLAAAGKRGSTARVGGELFSDAAGSKGTPQASYEGMVRANVDRLVEGLR